MTIKDSDIFTQSREIQNDNKQKFVYNTVCVSYEKKGVKRCSPKILLLEVQAHRPGKFKKFPLVQQVSTTKAQIKITNFFRKFK